MTAAALPIVGLLSLGAALILLRRPMHLLFRLLARSSLWLAVLSLLAPAGRFLGGALGANPVNALILGLLGIPGLGLLLMIQWMLR